MIKSDPYNTIRIGYACFRYVLVDYKQVGESNILEGLQVERHFISIRDNLENILVKSSLIC